MGYNFKAIQAAYPDKKLLIQEGIGVFDMDVSLSLIHISEPTRPY